MSNHPRSSKGAKPKPESKSKNDRSKEININ